MLGVIVLDAGGIYAGQLRSRKGRQRYNRVPGSRDGCAERVVIRSGGEVLGSDSAVNGIHSNASGTSRLSVRNRIIRISPHDKS